MKSQHLDWNDISLLLAICREGTVSGAARKLGVSHSTVSRRVDAIEKKWGVRLFERLANGYVMTEAGKLVLASAENIENEVFALSHNLLGQDSELRGPIRIALPDPLTSNFFMAHLSAFQKKYPDIQLHIHVANIFQNLTQREADIAIRGTRAPPENSVGRFLCGIATTVYGSREYLLDKQKPNFESLTWLVPDDDLANLPIRHWLASHYPKAHIGMYCNSMRAIAEAVKQDMGVAALPCFLADDDPHLQRLLPPITALYSELWLLMHPALRQTARIRAFVDFMCDALKADKLLFEGEASSQNIPTKYFENDGLP